MNSIIVKCIIQYIQVKNGALASKDDIPKKTGRLHEILGEAIILSAESNDSAEIRDNLGFILARENNRSSMDLDAPKPTKSKILTSSELKFNRK